MVETATNKSQKGAKSEAEKSPAPNGKDTSQKSKKEKVENQSDGASDVLTLPADYSAQRTVKKKEQAGELKNPTSTVPTTSGPTRTAPSTAPKSDKKQKIAVTGCYSSKVENYRIPSIVSSFFQDF